MQKSYTCCWCEADIYDGDVYYEIDGEIYCENCANEWLRDHQYTADIAGEMADRAYDAEIDRKAANAEINDEW